MIGVIRQQLSSVVISIWETWSPMTQSWSLSVFNQPHHSIWYSSEESNFSVSCKFDDFDQNNFLSITDSWFFHFLQRFFEDCLFYRKIFFTSWWLWGKFLLMIPQNLMIVKKSFDDWWKTFFSTKLMIMDELVDIWFLLLFETVHISKKEIDNFPITNIVASCRLMKNLLSSTIYSCHQWHLLAGNHGQFPQFILEIFIVKFPDILHIEHHPLAPWISSSPFQKAVRPQKGRFDEFLRWHFACHSQHCSNSKSWGKKKEKSLYFITFFLVKCLWITNTVLDTVLLRKGERERAREKSTRANL